MSHNLLVLLNEGFHIASHNFVQILEGLLLACPGADHDLEGAAQGEVATLLSPLFHILVNDEIIIPAITIWCCVQLQMRSLSLSSLEEIEQGSF